MEYLNPPCPLSAYHLTTDFNCLEPVLNIWLQKKARANQASGASRTFVVADKQFHVQGFYCLAAGAVSRVHATGSVRRNMPDPIPVTVLGRLAVNHLRQGTGLGADLLHDAVLRTNRLASELGIRALVVHALHEKAKLFYLRHGFSASPLSDYTLMLKLH